MLINELEYKYLRLQHGKVGRFQKYRDWQIAYEASILSDAKDLYKLIKDKEPQFITRILDIGSGLGGVNCLLNLHLKGQTGSILQFNNPKDNNIHYYLLDGLNDPPEHEKSFLTFSNSEVARGFLSNNGVDKSFFIDPENPKVESDVKFDLVFSFSSCGFHYNPQKYCEFIVDRMNPNSTLVFDIRKTRPYYLEVFKQFFGEPHSIIRDAEKYQRTVWELK